MNKLRSRKFWVAIATGFFLVLCKNFDISDAVCSDIMKLAIGYIGAEAAVDAARAYRNAVIVRNAVVVDRRKPVKKNEVDNEMAC